MFTMCSWFYHLSWHIHLRKEDRVQGGRGRTGRSALPLGFCKWGAPQNHQGSWCVKQLLLSYNWHTTNFTHFKCMIQSSLVNLHSCATLITTIQLWHFCHSKRVPHAWKAFAFDFKWLYSQITEETTIKSTVCLFPHFWECFYALTRVSK